MLEKQKAPSFLMVQCSRMERAMGIEPTSRAWEARILPMNYARDVCYDSRFARVCQTRSLLGQEHGEVGHELRDVADEDA